ncbi:hypothetical protein [Patulibacter medicamentivorans]|uniref:hypothetical protein n=1 Tax=Patulibacter medicamentivorans TaxID=1097667 RepID=UPI001110BFB0|nr:hypothetical protein [Patulibacter medicamentivorans]
MTGTNDPFLRLQHELGRVADAQAEAPAAPSSGRWQWHRRRGLLALGVGLVVAGTATAAAVVSQSGTSELDATARPDAPAVGTLNRLIHGMNDTAGGLAREGGLLDGPVRGTTIQRDGATVDVATDGKDVCWTFEIGSAACANLPIDPKLGLPTTIGSDEQHTWLVAFVPDGITEIAATSATGERRSAPAKTNVAVVKFDQPVEVQSLEWTLPDGETIKRPLRGG